MGTWSFRGNEFEHLLRARQASSVVSPTVLEKGLRITITNTSFEASLFLKFLSLYDLYTPKRYSNYQTPRFQLPGVQHWVWTGRLRRRERRVEIVV